MSAKITIVDEQDNVIGSVTKEEAWKKGLIRRIVRVFLIDSGKVFLQKRSPNKFPLPNRWSMSATGHVDTGESYMEAAKREVAEEIGIKEIELLELGEKRFPEIIHGINSPHFCTVFAAKHSGQTIVLQTEEVSEGKWITFPALDELILNNPDILTPGLINAWKEFRSSLTVPQ